MPRNLYIYKYTYINIRIYTHYIMLDSVGELLMEKKNHIKEVISCSYPGQKGMTGPLDDKNKISAPS